MPRVTCRAGPDRAVGIWSAHTVTLFAAAGHGGSPLQRNEGMRWPTSTARLIGFREVHLLGREAFLAVNRSPRRRGMTAMQKLLVNDLVATAAIARGEFARNDKAVVIFLFLSARGLVAVQAIHAFARMQAHLVFMDYGILCARMAFGTLPSCPD